MKPGDLGIVKSKGIPARVIQWGTHSRYNHAFVYIGVEDGVETLIEANPEKIGRKPLSEYDNREYLVSNVPLTDEQRDAIVTWAKKQVNKKYGWIDLFAIVLLSWGWDFSWVRKIAENQNHFVCSQLACEAAWKGDWDVVGNGKPWSATPGDMEESGDFVKRELQDVTR